MATQFIPLQIVNPSYTTFIAHRNPEVCPLGAMAFYFHWLHDLYDLPKRISIDWESNKSWRNLPQARATLRIPSTSAPSESDPPPRYRPDLDATLNNDKDLGPILIAHRKTTSSRCANHPPLSPPTIVCLLRE
jgi:hypothetical protein